MKRASMEKSDQCKTKRSKKYYSDARLKEISSIFLSDKKNANILIDLLDQLSVSLLNNNFIVCGSVFFL